MSQVSMPPMNMPISPLKGDIFFDPGARPGMLETLAVDTDKGADAHTIWANRVTYHRRYYSSRT